jgi:hypothetical protein
MLLDDSDIQIVNDYGLPIGKAKPRVGSKERACTYHRNSLVLPVAAGYKVSRPITWKTRENGPKYWSLLDHYQPLTPVLSPTDQRSHQGCVCGSWQGACNACEKIETDRLQIGTGFRSQRTEPPKFTLAPPTPEMTDLEILPLEDFTTPMVIA